MPVNFISSTPSRKPENEMLSPVTFHVFVLVFVLVLTAADDEDNDDDDDDVDADVTAAVTAISTPIIFSNNIISTFNTLSTASILTSNDVCLVSHTLRLCE